MGMGAALQRLIASRGSNVNEVATATGVKPQTLYSIIKRDSMKANMDDLYKVAKYLGVTLDYFYSEYLAENEKSAPASESNFEVEARAAQLYSALVDSGFINPGEDLTDKQLEALDAVCALLSVLFD